MRVAVGGVYHESNTFFRQPMTMERFGESHLDFGDGVVSRWRGTCSEMAGFVEGARRGGFEIVPTLMAWGMPAGPLTQETFDALAREMVERLSAAGPLDGVLVWLHGAMVSEHFAEADAEFLGRVRRAIGPKIPLVATTDYHANFNAEIVRWPDAIVGYDTYPHVDQVERGLEAADILRRMACEGLRPVMKLARRPLLPHILRQITADPPMSEVLARAHRWESQPGVIAVTVAAGFPYADVPEAGFSVVAVAENEETAFAAAEDIAELAWSRRAEFTASLPDAATAVREAIAQPHGLTILVDVGDNVGGGTPADGTVILSELLAQNACDALVLLCDPEAVAACAAAGVRSDVTLRVGGKFDRLHGDPVEIRGRVKRLSDGLFRNVGPMRDGVVEDQGRTAVVDTGGVLVVLTERRMPMWNLEQLRSVGIEPARLRIVVVKAAIAWRAAYAPIAQHIIEVDTPGLTAADVRRFHYRRLRRPIYPLDPL